MLKFVSKEQTFLHPTFIRYAMYSKLIKCRCMSIRWMFGRGDCYTFSCFVLAEIYIHINFLCPPPPTPLHPQKQIVPGESGLFRYPYWSRGISSPKSRPRGPLDSHASWPPSLRCTRYAHGLWLLWQPP